MGPSALGPPPHKHLRPRPQSRPFTTAHHNPTASHAGQPSTMPSVFVCSLRTEVLSAEVSQRLTCAVMQDNPVYSDTSAASSPRQRTATLPRRVPAFVAERLYQRNRSQSAAAADSSRPRKPQNRPGHRRRSPTMGTKVSQLLANFEGRWEADTSPSSAASSAASPQPAARKRLHICQRWGFQFATAAGLPLLLIT